MKGAFMNQKDMMICY